MPAKKDSVTTPLHLLQQLSRSLVVHLEKACSEAQKDAEVLLAKLEKQRGNTQEKVVKARAKLNDAGNAGKSKAQTKARAKLAELDDMLAVLQARQSETLNYLSELKRDAEQSLKLAQGISQVENAAAQALASRNKPAASRPAARSKASSSAATSAAAAKPAGSKAAPGQASTRAPRPAASRAKPAAAKSGATAKPVEAKAPTTKAPSASRGRPASNADTPVPAAKPVSAAKPAAAKKPATRKPAAAKRETETQSPPNAS